MYIIASRCTYCSVNFCNDDDDEDILISVFWFISFFLFDKSLWLKDFCPYLTNNGWKVCAFIFSFSRVIIPKCLVDFLKAHFLFGIKLYLMWKDMFLFWFGVSFLVIELFLLLGFSFFFFLIVDHHQIYTQYDDYYYHCTTY